MRADAFNALGKMGSAAIGGAIGGIWWAVLYGRGYQPSRGYIVLSRRLRKRKQRLRALDDKEFNLAVRDEEELQPAGCEG